MSALKKDCPFDPEFARGNKRDWVILFLVMSLQLVKVSESFFSGILFS